ncbi:MAG TPA: LLM class flavin-dependent oxidoreductase [Gemmataceae bacterium]|nr:LLM class flavin-dependent oxidoreductase [Gemmataceae bacterium]
MASPLKLGVLDQSPIPEGQPAGAALRNSVDLARLADQLGYHRYWVAEHHGTPGLACTSPEILIGQIAAATARIRVGSGGVMLPHYSPLKVAENFAILTGLFPGRIDLGVGRAAGTDAATTLALQRDRRRAMPDDFPEQFGELLGYFEGGPGAKRIPGGRPNSCEVWLLGSSPQSAIWAAELGLPYAVADFINPDGAPLAALYRERFTPGVRLAGPRVAVAGWAVCADTADEARALTASWRMLLALLHRGQLIAVPSVAKAQAFLAEYGPDGGGLPLRRRTITGTPPQVRAGIEALADEYRADEVLLVNILYDHAARRRSYELIAREFGL